MGERTRSDAATGIEGLDAILGKGLRRGAVHVIEGEAGSGKTTLALQFARAGVDAGERALYFSFSETVSELREIIRSHGWSEEGLALRHFNISEDVASGSPQTMLDPGELYLPQAAGRIRQAVEEVEPDRLVIDSLADLRLVSQDPWLLRSQLIYLRELLAASGRTTLLLDTQTEYSQHLRTLASGIVSLEQGASQFGSVRRQLTVLKMRARAHATGPHDFDIVTGGLQVYSRLEAGPPPVVSPGEPVSSSIGALDDLLGGGLERGTSALVLGPAGVGKSLLLTLYGWAAAKRGEKTSVYLFDERRHTFLERSRGVGLDLGGPVKDGSFSIRRVDPGQMTPGQFAHVIREDVEQRGTDIVAIDSLSGYLHAMPDVRHLQLHLHELMTYLARKGVLSIMILGEHGPFEAVHERSLDLSYLADTVLLMRYFEYAGEMRRAISIYKKRSGDHERLIREVRVGPGGLVIGEPLRHFRGVLTGLPEYLGDGLAGT